ncbi:hypothetical protein [Solemya velesiana gill symbiont]|uniref:Uncharacterized protein n=1 Tax=Solemya velesiana gill symbiont TaxID=1918948 RepID=A0A1T2KWI7_9GAMM|nr:hypothetical protein [Solemya velesiana gill symbiont]OOZ37205.1 hypothetical protein BOW51_03560 [Solemya velesiana gill symbiont]
MLEKAKQRLKSEKLSYPSGDSAKDYYQQALVIAPDNPEARKGLQQVADRYAALARQSLSKQRKMKAERYITQGLAVAPGHEGLKLQRDLRNGRQQQSTSPNKVEDIFDRLNPGD